MSIKLTGATSGSIELDVPAAVSGGDISLTLPNGVGSAGQVLKDSSTAGTLEFAQGGTILQVKQTFVNTPGSQTITAKTLTDISNLSVDITPKQSDSNMLIFVKWSGETNDDNHKTVFGLKRDSTVIGSPAAAGNRLVGISGLYQGYHTEDNTSTQDAASYSFLDTGRTAGTTQITYKATILNHSTVNVYNNRTVTNSDSDEHEHLASSILVMEVAT